MPSVRVERTTSGFVASNGRGARVDIGHVDEEGVFSPVELLLAALGGCELLTVEPLTAQRGHRLVRLSAVIDGELASQTKLGKVTITYDVELPEGDERAEEILKSVADRVHTRYCTVGKALKEPTTVVQKLP